MTEWTAPGFRYIKADGTVGTLKEWRDHLDSFRAPIYDSLMEGRCTNCRLPECHCCQGCGQTDADIIGSHGYHCML